MVRIHWFSWLVLCLHSAQAWEKTTVPEGFVMPEPLTLEKSVASIQTRPGFQIELVAAEPMVMDPVYIDFGHDGSLWVVEMADYPLGMDGAGKPGGRVRMLEDRDRDGRFDHSTLFLEGLNFPTGVKEWRDGVLIIACPEILFARDTDGDGKANEVETLYRGFREGNQQHRVNGLVWGLDNWLHIANGDSGGKVESILTGETIELGSSDLRIRPDSGEMQLTSGRTQYGRVRDDLGNWFGNNNSKPLWHFALPRKLMDQNPHVIFEDRIHMVSNPPRAPKIYPAGTSAPRFNNPDSVSHITSACGISIMRDHHLGKDLLGNAFICEPVHNLVHRQVLVPNGITFDGQRAAGEEESEFVASTDHWFRPVHSVTGPDGGLWIVDMHRYVIEHPEWIPEDWEKVLDLRAGEDRGRIYRITRDQSPTAPLPRLDSSSPREWIRMLSSPNGWVRDTAQQQLGWLEEPPSADSLVEEWTNHASTLGKIHILGLLENRGIPSILLFEAMTSPAPELQRFALRLTNETHLNPAILGEVSRLASSSDPRVRYEALACLGRLEIEEAGIALSRIVSGLLTESDQAAIAMGLANHLSPIAGVIASDKDPARFRFLSASLFETAIGMNVPPVVNRMLSVDQEFNFRTLLSVLDRRRIRFESFLNSSPSDLKTALLECLELATTSRAIASDSANSAKKRVEAMNLVGRQKEFLVEDIQLLLSLLHPKTELDVARAAVVRLVEMRDFSFWNKWASTSPEIHSVMLEHGIRHLGGAESFLDLVESGNIPRVSIPAAATEKLRSHWNNGIRDRAATTFEALNSNRREVVLSYSKSLSLEGNPEKGRTHFSQLCASCHALGNLGVAVGADLASLADKSPQSLLTAIIDPNLAVEDKYQLQIMTLTDESRLTGMLIGESGQNLALQTLDGTVHEIPRTRVQSLENTGRSAMPVGLEAALDHQAMADLIAFLRGTP